MGHENSQLIANTRLAEFRLCNISGYKTDVMEIRAKDPTLHVLFIPGNPGVVSFYRDFLESLYELLGGTASITAVGHLSHTEKNWEQGRLFSLKEQTDHKISFIQQEVQDTEVPIILVGHSIGAYISVEVFRRFPEKVIRYIGLYPFLAVNTGSQQQSVIKSIAMSQFLCATLGFLAALIGSLPTCASRFIAKKSLGKSWSATAIEAFHRNVLQYHTVRNMLFMAMTEFKKLVEAPDWVFMRGKQSQMAFLFGLDDHWGPLQMLDEIVKQIPGAVVEIEKEGHTHAFSCTKAGSLWVAQFVASLIKSQKSN